MKISPWYLQLCAANTGSKTRWPHGRNAYFRGVFDKSYIRLHAIPFFSLSNWETGASERHDRARDWSERGIARPSLSITVDEKRKGLSAVYSLTYDRSFCWEGESAYNRMTWARSLKSSLMTLATAPSTVSPSFLENGSVITFVFSGSTRVLK